MVYAARPLVFCIFRAHRHLANWHHEGSCLTCICELPAELYLQAFQSPHGAQMSHAFISHPLVALQFFATNELQ